MAARRWRARRSERLQPISSGHGDAARSAIREGRGGQSAGQRSGERRAAGKTGAARSRATARKATPAQRMEEQNGSEGWRARWRAMHPTPSGAAHQHVPERALRARHPETRPRDQLRPHTRASGVQNGGARCALRRGSRAPRARASKAAAGARPTRAQARAHGELGDRLGDFEVESLDQRDFQGETPQAVALVRVVKRGLKRGNVLWARADTYELLVRVAVLLQSRHPRLHRLVPEILIRLGDFELEAFSVPLKVIRFIMSS